MSRSSFPPTIPTPAPPSLHGVLRVSSPASPVLRDAPTPCLRPAALRHLHGPYHAGLARRSQARGASPAWVWGLVTRVPHPGFVVRRGQGLPGSWTSPMRTCPAPGPRWNLRVWPRSRRVDAVFRCCDGVDFHGAQLSGLTPAACTLPVYASQRRLPDHHATLGSGWWPAFAGRDWRPAGTLRGFPSFAYPLISSPLPRLCLAQHNYCQYLTAQREAPMRPSCSRARFLSERAARHLGLPSGRLVGRSLTDGVTSSTRERSKVNRGRSTRCSRGSQDKTGRSRSRGCRSTATRRFAGRR